MTEATINGNTYSDQASSGAVRGMANGGHRTWLMPMLTDIVTVAQSINGAGVLSTTSLAIGAGTKSYTVTGGTAIYSAGMVVKAVSLSDFDDYEVGTVVSHSGGVLEVEVPAEGVGPSASGTHADWVIVPFSAPVASATETVAGLVRLATDAEEGAGTAENAVPTVAGVQAMIDTFARNNLLLNFLGDEIGHSVAAGEMQDGVADAFASDTIGATSDGEAYNSSRDDYSNPGAASLIAQGTGTPIGDMVNNGGLAAAFDSNTSQATGACAAFADGGVQGSGYVGKDWGVATTKTVVEFTVTAPNNQTLSDHTVKLRGSANGSAWTDLMSTVAGPASGATLNVTSGITTTTPYRYHSVLLTKGGANIYCAEVTFSETGTPANITLMPGPTTALAAPSDSRLLILHDPVDVVTVNTDIKAFVSRDNGRTVTANAGTNKLALTAQGGSDGDRGYFTNSGGALPAGLVANKLYHQRDSETDAFQVSLTAGGSSVDITDAGSGTTKWHKAAAVTLTSEGAYDANHNILAGAADVSALPTGTRMMWIIETLNAKEQRVRGVAQMWS
jgi:hypothetical protein